MELSERLAAFRRAYGLETADAPTPDPCARLTVKPIRGGIPDVPIEHHETVKISDPSCSTRFLGKCHHTPACIPLRVVACHPGVPCRCGPFVGKPRADWESTRVGTVSRGLSAPRKAPKRVTYPLTRPDAPSRLGYRPQALQGPILGPWLPQAELPTSHKR